MYYVLTVWQTNLLRVQGTRLSIAIIFIIKNIIISGLLQEDAIIRNTSA